MTTVTSAKVIEASAAAETCITLITQEVTYPRFIHAELMTHRVFSRNASSSRAIPVRKVLAQVWSDPACPIHWGTNKPGMQASEELSGIRLRIAKAGWRMAGKVACIFAWSLMKLGGHKQWVNRILEPWQWMHVVITSTEWENFFNLRAHPDAQPEIQHLAILMQEAIEDAKPVKRSIGDVGAKAWHLPYVTAEERETFKMNPELLAKMSSARCARVSYLKHDGESPGIQEDINLHDRLVGSEPIHASPTEHQAKPSGGFDFVRNFRGWVQYRVGVEAMHYLKKRAA